jgi:hypothetical protein
VTGQQKQKEETPMKQYMLSVYHQDAGPALAPEVMAKSIRDVDAINAEMMTAGAWVFAGGLHNDSAASVVRVKDGAVVTTDGPYIEAKERIGGFWVIQADDLDAALAWARKATVACVAPVEVRPFMDEPDA